MQVILHPTLYCSLHCPGCYAYKANTMVSKEAINNYYKLAKYIKVDELNILINQGQNKQLFDLLEPAINSVNKITVLTTPFQYEWGIPKTIKNSKIEFHISIDRYKLININDIFKFNKDQNITNYNVYIYDQYDFDVAYSLIELMDKPVYIVFSKKENLSKYRYDYYVDWANKLKSKYGAKIHIDTCMINCTANRTVSVFHDGYSFCPVVHSHLTLEQTLNIIRYKKIDTLYKDKCVNKWR